MERFEDGTALSTSGAAELLSVHPSTVKRWADDGAPRARKTDGGHRRFELAEVLRSARDRGIPTYLDPFSPYEAHVWAALEDIRRSGSFRRFVALAMGWVGRGRHERVGRLVEALGRHPEVPFTLLVDEGVGGVMARVGDAWRGGRLRVGDEHLVSQVLTESLLRLRDADAPSDAAADGGARAGSEKDDRAPRALVGSTEGDPHHIGALCVRLVLERAGWRVLYLGPSVPVEDFASLQRARSADMVCVSFSPRGSGSGSDPHRSLRILEGLYDPAHPYALALGGAAVDGALGPAPSGPFREVGTFRTCEAFLEALDAGFGRIGAARPDRRVPAVSRRTA